MNGNDRSSIMDPLLTTSVAPLVPSSLSKTRRDGDKTNVEKRKPVRRDPEKRRQQNIQAQKKYRESPSILIFHENIMSDRGENLIARTR